MSEERPHYPNPFRDGMTPYEFINLIKPVLDQGDLEPDIREILEREVERAKSHSPFATLSCIYEDGRMLFRWTTRLQIFLDDDLNIP